MNKSEHLIDELLEMAETAIVKMQEEAIEEGHDLRSCMDLTEALYDELMTIRIKSN
jgi:hypothetical protein